MSLSVLIRFNVVQCICYERAAYRLVTTRRPADYFKAVTKSRPLGPRRTDSRAPGKGTMLQWRELVCWPPGIETKKLLDNGCGENASSLELLPGRKAWRRQATRPHVVEASAKRRNSLPQAPRPPFRESCRGSLRHLAAGRRRGIDGCNGPDYRRMSRCSVTSLAAPNSATFHRRRPTSRQAVTTRRAA